MKHSFKSSRRALVAVLTAGAVVGSSLAASAAEQTSQAQPMQSVAAAPYTFEATDANFQKTVVEASRNGLVVVDFYAVWCGPCKTLKPIIEKEVANGKGSWKLGELNTQTNRVTTGNHQIKYIPTLVAYGNGKVIGRKDGFTGGAGELRTWIAQMKKLAPKPSASGGQ